MEIKNRQTLYEGFYKLYKLTLRHEGETFDREVFQTGTAVGALVYHTGKKKFIFVKQFRAGVEEEVTEIVAGLHDQPGESLEEALQWYKLNC
jgi:ADP-ribose pyrophosphatase